MTTIAEGKDEVLAYLEREAQDRTGKPGVYKLIRDDSGNLVAFIAGRSLIGTGSFSLAGNRMLTVDGLVVHVDKSSAA